MRTFTVTYKRGGRLATATVQGNEITTMDDVLCIREDGIPLATFPMQDVLHVTSNGPEDDWPALAEEALGMPCGSTVDTRPELPEKEQTRLRTAIDRTPQPAAGERVARRMPTGSEPRRRIVAGGVVGSGT